MKLLGRWSASEGFGLNPQTKKSRLSFAVKVGRNGPCNLQHFSTIAVPVAYDVWSSRLRKTESVNYFGNVGAQFALTEGRASSLQFTKLCHYCATVLERSTMLVWRARVPSASTVAGAPSRQVPSLLLPSALKRSCDCVNAAWARARVTSAVGLGCSLVPTAA